MAHSAGQAETGLPHAVRRSLATPVIRASRLLASGSLSLGFNLPKGLKASRYRDPMTEAFKAGLSKMMRSSRIVVPRANYLRKGSLTAIHFRLRQSMYDDPDFSTEPTAAFDSFEEATRYLEQLCDRMRVNHLAYALMRSTGETQDIMAWVATYDPAYMSYYMEHYTQFGDPAFEVAFANEVVIDWSEMASDDLMSQELLPVAARYGITKYGISIPLRESETDSVLFSVNVKSSDEEWLLLRPSLIERFRPLAHHFHERIKPLIELRELSGIDFES